MFYFENDFNIIYLQGSKVLANVLFDGTKWMGRETGTFIGEPDSREWPFLIGKTL